jgi:hypothetical protein
MMEELNSLEGMAARIVEQGRAIEELLKRVADLEEINKKEREQRRKDKHRRTA